jgi:hypothetical protein
MKAKPKTTEPHRKKATRALSAARVADVLRVRLDGAQFWQLRQYVREQEAAGALPWKLESGHGPLSDAQLYRYVVRADKELAKSIEKDREKLIREHVGKRRMIYARAINKGDERTALAAARDECELLGLYPPSKREVTGPNGGPLLLTAAVVQQMPEDDRLAYLRHLIALAKTRGAAVPLLTDDRSAAADHQADGAGGTDDGK